MKKGYSRIVALVDESGSMDHLKESTLAGLNDFIREQKRHPDDADFSLFFFDKKISSVTHWNIHEGKPGFDYNIRRTIRERVPIQKVEEVKWDEYNPYGSTPLLDALGDTIDELGRQLRETPEKQRPEHVIVCVITDGYENASLEYDRAKIKKMIEHQRETYKWTFVFLGANQDSFTEAGNMGFNMDHVANFSTTDTGARYSSNAASYVANYTRSGLACTLRSFEEKDYEDKESSTSTGV
ncbi:MAG: vWA domain-containing protein [Candidatus Thorarchaeota archaeon]